MAVNSTNYKFNTPTTGTEEDTWGDKLNENWDKMDSLLYGASYTDSDGNTVEQIQPDLAEGSWAIAGTAVTATAAELNILDGVTATATEINCLSGIPATVTGTELGYVDGVTSAIQTQIDAKIDAAGGTFTGAVDFEANVHLDDDDQIILGTDNDFRLHHDTVYGSATNVNRIYSTATGGLYIENNDASASLQVWSDTTLISSRTGTPQYAKITSSGLQLKSTGTTVDTILDEDDLASDSATALATQQSIKAYVDNKVGSGTQTLLATMIYSMDSGEYNKIILPTSLRNYDTLMIVVETYLGVANFGIRNYDVLTPNASMDRTDFYAHTQSTTSNGEFDINTDLTKTYQTGSGGLMSYMGSEYGFMFSDNISSSGENSFWVRNERSSAVSFNLQFYGIKN